MILYTTKLASMKRMLVLEKNILRVAWVNVIYTTDSNVS